MAANGIIALLTNIYMVHCAMVLSSLNSEFGTLFGPEQASTLEIPSTGGSPGAMVIALRRHIHGSIWHVSYHLPWQATRFLRLS